MKLLSLAKLIYDLFGETAVESLLTALNDTELDSLIEYILNGIG